MKNIYFIDLDNTVMFTKQHIEALMGPVYRLLEKEDLEISNSDLGKVKDELLRTPFQKVAEKYRINKKATERVTAFLQEATPLRPIAVHDEYHYIKNLTGRKFLITAGFTKMQSAKIEMLGISSDFEEIIILDNTKTSDTKKEVFQKVMDRHHLPAGNILVIGDDAESEIRYGLALGLDTFLFDPDEIFPAHPSTYRGKSLADLVRHCVN